MLMEAIACLAPVRLVLPESVVLPHSPALLKALVSLKKRHAFSDLIYRRQSCVPQRSLHTSIFRRPRRIVVPLLLASQPARLLAGVRQIVSDLQLVRMQAVARNRRLRVTFQPGTNRYVVEKRENGRWLGHHLQSHGDRGNDGVYIRLPSTVVISAANSRGDVIFVPRGHVDGSMTLPLTSRDGKFSNGVVINLAGRVRID